MCRTAEDGEEEDIKEQIRKAIEWVAGIKKGDQPRWIAPPDGEQENRQDVLVMAMGIMEEEKQKVSEADEGPEGEEQGRWRALRRGRGRHMQFGKQNKEREWQGDGEDRQAKEAGGGELGQEDGSHVGDIGRTTGDIMEGGHGAAEDGDQGNGSGGGMSGGQKDDGEEAGDSGAGDRVKGQREEE